jgi:hypothetical protein
MKPKKEGYWRTTRDEETGCLGRFQIPIGMAVYGSWHRWIRLRRSLRWWLIAAFRGAEYAAATTDA